MPRTGDVKVAVADPASKDAKWCMAQYFSELDRRFEGGFDPRVTRPTPPRELRPPRGLLLIAHLRKEPVGCGALKFHEDGVAEIKRLWVAPKIRGRGVGRRLLAELEKSASESGVKVLRLDTNKALREAMALYRSSNYEEVERFNDEPYAHFWFEKRLGSKSLLRG